MLREQLQRHIALEALIEGEVHRGHPADAEASFDPVPTGDCRCAAHCPLPFPGPPPMPAPPLEPVDEVPEPVVVVAVLELVGVVVLVVVELVGVLDVVVEDVVVLVGVLVELVVLDVVVVLDVLLVVLEVVEHWCAVRFAIVLASWLRFCCSVPSTDEGRPAT